MAWIKNSRGVDCWHDESWDSLADQLKAQAKKWQEYKETLDNPNHKLSKQELEEALKQAQRAEKSYNDIQESLDRIQEATEKQEKQRDNVRTQFEDYEKNCGSSSFTSDPLVRAFLGLKEKKLPQSLKGFPDIKNFRK